MASMGRTYRVSEQGFPAALVPVSMVGELLILCVPKSSVPVARLPRYKVFPSVLPLQTFATGLLVSMIPARCCRMSALPDRVIGRFSI